MKLFFIFPLSGPNNGVKVISNHIYKAVTKRNIFSVVKVDTAQAKGYENFGKFSFKKIQSIWSILKEMRGISGKDAVYMNITPKGYAFYRDFVFLFFCYTKTKNITVHVHANGLEKKINFYNKFLFSKIKIIVINELQERNLKSHSNNIFKISNSLPNYFRDSEFENLKEEELKFIFISNLSKEKGVDRLVKLSEFIFEREINCEINVYGGALSKESFDEIKRLDMNYSFFNYKGVLFNEDEKYEALKSNDVLLFLSDVNYEVYPLVYIEALMSGVPIVTTNQVVAQDLVELDVAKIVDENVSDFGVIIDWLKDSKNIKELKHKSRQAYLRNYVFDDFINDIEKIVINELQK